MRLSSSRSRSRKAARAARPPRLGDVLGIGGENVGARRRIACAMAASAASFWADGASARMRAAARDADDLDHHGRHIGRGNGFRPPGVDGRDLGEAHGPISVEPRRDLAVACLPRQSAGSVRRMGDCASVRPDGITRPSEAHSSRAARWEKDAAPLLFASSGRPSSIAPFYRTPTLDAVRSRSIRRPTISCSPGRHPGSSRTGSAPASFTQQHRSAGDQAEGAGAQVRPGLFQLPPRFTADHAGSPLPPDAARAGAIVFGVSVIRAGTKRDPRPVARSATWPCASPITKPRLTWTVTAVASRLSAPAWAGRALGAQAEEWASSTSHTWRGDHRRQQVASDRRARPWPLLR